MSSKNSGILIVIEGGDGLGKTTQLKLVENKLRSMKNKVKKYDFPHKSGSPVAELISSFLNGKFGQIEPEFLSLAFAADRFASKTIIEKDLLDNSIVLCDRYTLSNIAFQVSKINDDTRKHKLINLINWLEYEVYSLPKPDLEIVITAPNFHYIKGSYLNRSNSIDRGYTISETDIHEKDEGLQVEVNNFFSKLSKEHNRVFINAYENDMRKSIEQVNDEIMFIVKKYIQGV